MTKQEFQKHYDYYTKGMPKKRLTDLENFLTSEYVDHTISKMYKSFFKTKSIKERIKILDMFKEHLRPRQLDLDLDEICKRLGVD